ncbi:dephospho-CoA kinase [Candidatus Thiothrix anitrata]|jgi:dephospho-CoA kinase|uniref:Dephospho-CoA kinase n=1 Tax=Candidatus Thiothrix anitrata TaxID=2823902 RepID=A0ABX7X6S7_9GAMM|nr:dephospho-CoA kinase [Candidatus Thiothrix anitrata]QTR51406.1 dephospho-CoA kinase [Candidatus Thiothrix anitrata]
MLKIGLTGGIGCGKSTAVKRFRDLGIPIVDADIVAREVVQAGQPALQAIAELFGDAALLADGSLNRAWLRQTVFNDTARLQQLEAILHPRIREAIVRDMTAAMAAGSPYVVVDVPLLFEKHYDTLFDRVLVIDCLPAQQHERVSQRDGSTIELVESIMQRQIPRDERLFRADDIIENVGSLADFNNKVDTLHHKYAGNTAT